MSRQRARIAFRHLRRHSWQVGLAVLSIALGVAVAVSIDLANESALSDDLYRALPVDQGADPAAPVATGMPTRRVTRAM